jgi:hypothetical protein
MSSCSHDEQTQRAIFFLLLLCISATNKLPYNQRWSK